ncbi:MAG TPA: response regulator transcription factor [Candidatus Angelobacter sp.]|nr:response regulator transcription factor [Candidatus Angelobacter sp.]
MLARVLLADDHQVVRDGLKAILEKQGYLVSAEASNGQEAVRLALETHPDVAILDIAMPVLNGIDAAREILRSLPSTKVILLTMYAEKGYVLEGLRAGIKGFVTKTHAAEELVRAVREAAKGTTYLSPEVSSAVVEAYQTNYDIAADPLTPRERQVLQLIAEGRSSKEVAAELNISVKTAETHRSRILEKLDIHEVAGLVRYAIRRGLIRA